MIEIELKAKMIKFGSYNLNNAVGLMIMNSASRFLLYGTFGLLVLLVVYRITYYIPAPGVN